MMRYTHRKGSTRFLILTSLEASMKLSICRKKLRTAEYIFQTLFKEGKNSDVTVLALGNTFHLHKIYLCQSSYFASMFGGSWLESTKNLIPIEIVDPRITVECK